MGWPHWWTHLRILYFQMPPDHLFMFVFINLVAKMLPPMAKMYQICILCIHHCDVRGMYASHVDSETEVVFFTECKFPKSHYVCLFVFLPVERYMSNMHSNSNMLFVVGRMSAIYNCSHSTWILMSHYRESHGKYGMFWLVICNTETNPDALDRYKRI